VPSFTYIELDTTAPRVTFGFPRRYGDAVGIPYRITEPKVLAASYVTPGSDPLESLVLLNSLWVFNAPTGDAQLVVTTRDDVWNTDSQVLSVTGQTVGEKVLTGRYRGTIQKGLAEAGLEEAHIRPQQALRKLKAYHQDLATQVAYGVRIR
jgi:hypothetical protein